jgi:hypothetical protein
MGRPKLTLNNCQTPLAFSLDVRRSNGSPLKRTFGFAKPCVNCSLLFIDRDLDALADSFERKRLRVGQIRKNAFRMESERPRHRTIELV